MINEARKRTSDAYIEMLEKNNFYTILDVRIYTCCALYLSFIYCWTRLLALYIHVQIACKHYPKKKHSNNW